MNKFYLFGGGIDPRDHRSFEIQFSFFFLLVYKFILFLLFGWKSWRDGRFGRTWKTSIEQNQSQEARCQPNVMKTYPSGLGRLLPTWDESRPRKRKSEVKRDV